MLRIAGVIRESIVDGPGLRFVVFTQGCTHNCEGCHNPATHALDGGYEITSDRILTEFFKNPLLKGITLSGGEPFLQAGELVPIAKSVKEGKKDVVIYTGYTLEALRAMNDNDVNELLSYCDVLVDGPFILAQRDLTLTFKGSRNQRIIDMNETRKQGSIVLLEV
ncbi:MAG: anaerobic ribonucleoside-triphosphate reductase activating protein [Clostridia bacterium]|nr:anaerobic ribonucleoside-triphosphate reductase activating protein [Clostridia bacterium]